MRSKISLLRKITLAVFSCVFLCLPRTFAAETVNIVALIPGEGQLRDKFIATKNRLEADWQGDVDIVLLVDGQVGTEESMISTVRRGRSQLAMLSTPGTSAAIPEMSLLMAPYLFDSFEEADFVLDNFVTEKAAELLADKGLHFIQWIDSGWFNVFSQTAIRTPEDAVGQRMRAAGGPAARIFLQLVGADVAQLPFSDLVPGLQTGLLSGGATNTSMYRTVALYELAPFITLTRHGINPAAVFANKTWFDQLSQNNQDLVMAGISPTAVVRRDVRTEGAEALVYASAQGATVIELTNDQRKLWKDATRTSHYLLIDEIGGQAAEVYELIQEGRSAFAGR